MTHPVPIDAAVPGDALILPDGGAFLVRPITPASKSLIASAMRRLSAESIRRRFFAPRRELSDLELHRLTALDGWNQYALGACARGPDGTLEGVGVARFARLDEDRRTAEIAVTVVDAYQSRGIGSALLARLIAVATTRGIRRLQALSLPDNAPVQRLLRRFAPAARWRDEGDHLAMEFALAAEPVSMIALA